MSAKLARLATTAQSALDTYLSQIRQGNNPATFLGLTNADQELYFGATGERVFGQPGEVDENTVLQLWSSTKLVTAVAALQQVEPGHIGLDDEKRLDEICPELARLQILKGYTEDGKAILEPARRRMTLRMLLNHTCGIPYSISNPDILRYVKENDIAEIESSCPSLSSFTLPLLHEPGTRWTYGMGLDWAGIMVERLSGLSLEEYFKRHIWSVCGVENISFHPPSDWNERGMGMTTRFPFHDGTVRAKRGKKTADRSMDQKFGPIYSGGAGLFGTPKDYLRFLRGILLSGRPDLSSTSEKRLLTHGSYKLLFTDTLPDDPQIRKDVKGFIIATSIYDQPANLDDSDVGFAPGSLVIKKDLPFGRKAFSATWEGMTKTYHWIDPTSGIAGICHTNLFSPPPDIYRKVFNGFERIVYDHLVPSGTGAVPVIEHKRDAKL